MGSATILMHPSTALAVFYFPSEPNFPEWPEYEKISTLYQCTWINTHTRGTMTVVEPLNYLEKKRILFTVGAAKQSSRPCGFRHEDFSCFPYIRLCDPWGGAIFGPRGIT